MEKTFKQGDFIVMNKQFPGIPIYIGDKGIIESCIQNLGDYIVKLDREDKPRPIYKDYMDLEEVKEIKLRKKS
jgi:signal peptidase I